MSQKRQYGMSIQKEVTMNKLFLIFTAVFLFTILGAAQTSDVDSIDSFINSSLDDFKEVPSVSIAIIKDNTPILTKSYGYSNLETKTKSTISTAYYIASNTKSYVGLLAVILEEDGLLDLNKPITEYAPIKNFSDNTIFKGITITDLLSHTSGIENPFLARQFASIGDYTRADMVRILEKETFSLFNKKAHRYTNFGYNVFDLILSEEFGKNWKDLLREKIFAPMKMNRTSAYLSKAKKAKWNLAQPYTAINNLGLPTVAKTQKNDATFQSAGGMITSIEDAQKWLMMNMNQGKLGNKQIFPNSVISKAQTKIVNTRGRRGTFKNTGYGLGWTHANFGDNKIIYHTGGFDGYYSHISYLPEHNIGIAIFANESHFGDNVADLIVSYAYDLLLKKITSGETYTNKIRSVRKRIDAIQSAFSRDRSKRTFRKWKLSFRLGKYVGEFKNKNLGTIKIRKTGTMINAQWGISKSIGEPSFKRDAIRVEFRDSQSGDLLFIFQNKKAVAVVYGGNVFYKK